MTFRTLSLLAASVAVGSLFAQDNEPQSDDAAPQTGAPAGGEAAKPAAKLFVTLPFCQMADGTAEVMLPGSKVWERVEEGRFYPFGTTYRTCGENSKMVVAFGPESKAVIKGDSSFGTKPQAVGGASRTLVVIGGDLSLDLARNAPEGAVFVTAPGFTVKNLAGESSIRYRTLPDGDEAVVRCVTGSLGVEGRHFDIPQMRAADEVRIRSTVDHLVTFLYGNSGDYVIKLDRGIVTRNDVDEEGKVSQVSEKATLDWRLSPKTKVRIDRMVPSIGERLSVAVMTFDAVGEMKNNFAFAEGRAEVNSGELVVAPAEEGETEKKKAAEASEETTTTAPSEEDEKADEDDSENVNKENKKQEEQE